MTKRDIELRLIVLDDAFALFWSHWAYDTEELKILSRIRYDLQGFEKLFCKALKTFVPNVLAFSGKGAAQAATKLDRYVGQLREPDILSIYNGGVKAMRVQNTFLSERLEVKTPTLEDLRTYPNTWLRVALDYPFNILMIQTYGDAEIINKVTNLNIAHYVPFSYNDRLFYPHGVEQDLDIGMFFKLERHPHRLHLVEYVQTIAQKRGWRCEFSDQLWGKDYAEAICRSKILLHYSYFGDVPYRLYEAAGSRLCLLTDPLSFGIEQNSSRESEFVEFRRDLSDLEAKIEWLLGNPSQRKKIATCAYYRAKSQHTWAKRVEHTIAPLFRSILVSKS